LPPDVEDSLRFVARKTRSTLNSVVIDCLKEHLPAVHPVELAVMDWVSPFPEPKERLRSDALDRLNRYEDAVQLQLGVVLQIAGLLNAQASLARKMRDSLVRGHDVRVPDDSSGNPPQFASREGTISPKLLAYIEGAATIKNNEALKAGRKQASRHHYEAVSEWEAVKVLLRRFVDAEMSSSER
jgi:hypothetical protein